MAASGLWSPPQACLWIDRREEVARPLETHTFFELALETGADVVWNGISPMTFPILPDWIVDAQKELLGACFRGDIKLIGRPSSGGSSEEIPGPACATARFFCVSLRRGEWLGLPEIPPRVYWTDLWVAAEDVRRIWPADRSATAANEVRQVNTRRSPVPRREYGGRASQSDHDAWFTSYRDACIAAGKSPNSKADEKAGIEAFGSRFDRDRARDSRRRLAPSDWRSSGKRTGKT
jgi:hypothetical protein